MLDRGVYHLLKVAYAAAGILTAKPFIKLCVGVTGVVTLVFEGPIQAKDSARDKTDIQTLKQGAHIFFRHDVQHIGKKTIVIAARRPSSADDQWQRVPDIPAGKRRKVSFEISNLLGLLSWLPVEMRQLGTEPNCVLARTAANLQHAARRRKVLPQLL